MGFLRRMLKRDRKAVEGDMMTLQPNLYFKIQEGTLIFGGDSGTETNGALILLVADGSVNKPLALIRTASNIATLGSDKTKMMSSGTLTDSDSADIKCDARIRVDIGGTPYWIPAYDTAP
jgi:hypothetical protein